MTNKPLNLTGKIVTALGAAVAGVGQIPDGKVGELSKGLLEKVNIKNVSTNQAALIAGAGIAALGGIAWMVSNMGNDEVPSRPQDGLPNLNNGAKTRE